MSPHPSTTIAFTHLPACQWWCGALHGHCSSCQSCTHLTSLVPLPGCGAVQQCAGLRRTGWRTRGSAPPQSGSPAAPEPAVTAHPEKPHLADYRSLNTVRTQPGHSVTTLPSGVTCSHESSRAALLPDRGSSPVRHQGSSMCPCLCAPAGPCSEATGSPQRRPMGQLWNLKSRTI